MAEQFSGMVLSGGRYDDVKDVLDLCQFAFKDERGTHNAINTLGRFILKHLEQPKECPLLSLAQHLTPFSPMSYWRK